MKKPLTLTALAAFTTLLYGCNGSDSPPAQPQLSCADITTQALAIPGLVITSATANGATAADSSQAAMPAHCQVDGYLNQRKSDVDNQQYAIGFELRLPNDWNGRFFFQGGGGTDGAVNPAVGSLPGDGQTTNALSEGYAVASTDGGHESVDDGTPVGGALFGVDPQARIDYGYNAVGVVTDAAQTIIERHYDKPADHSYFVGCSNGGRQAMVAASRFADKYDGVIAGNPGFNLPKAALEHAWDNQQFASVAPIDSATSRPIIEQSFTVQDMTLVAEKVLAKCDALDGLADGLIQNSNACQAAFDPVEELTCTGSHTTVGTDCLGDTQKVAALVKVFSGPSDSQGKALYADWPWDAGVGGMGWRIWKLAMPFPNPDPTIPNSIIATMGGASLPYVFMTPPVQISGAGHGIIDYLLGYNFDTDAPGIYRTTGVYTESSMAFMTPPDLTFSKFKEKGGKMIVYHGNSDPVFSVHDTIQWYKNLTQSNSNAKDFARLFTVPGMNHCGSGPATSQFDMLSALVNWVEKGTAPDQIIGQAPSGTTLTDVESRPLCPYPQYAKYNGGDPKVASSFSCVAS